MVTGIYFTLTSTAGSEEARADDAKPDATTDPKVLVHWLKWTVESPNGIGERRQVNRICLIRRADKTLVETSYPFVLKLVDEFMLASPQRSWLALRHMAAEPGICIPFRCCGFVYL